MIVLILCIRNVITIITSGLNQLNMSQTTIVSFFKYNKFKYKWQAFARMGLPPLRFSKVAGLKFWKAMGVGGENGFSIKADLSTYSLVTVFETEQDAAKFYNGTIMKIYTNNCVEHRSFFMHCIQTHGIWGGSNPFLACENPDLTKRIAIITRATIKPRLAIKFWKFVPEVSKSLDNYVGLSYSKGFGEWPILMQATFSVWDTLAHMKAYAYENPSHAAMVKKTRELNWYKEEMFSRFVVWDEKNDIG